MTATQWSLRILSVLLAIGILLGSLLALGEMLTAAMGRPAVVPYPQWAEWLGGHSWNDGVVNVVLVSSVVIGLLLMLLALRRGRPATLGLRGPAPGVEVTASRRSVEKSLADAASRTTGVAGATVSVGRRSVRVKAKAVTRSDSGIQQAVQSAVKERLDSLQLARPLRTRVHLSTKGRS